MAVLADPETGRTIVVDIASGSLDLPAELPSHTVQEGLPPTWRRTVLPASCDVDAYLSDVPGEGAPRAEVQDWLDDAAAQNRRLRLAINGIPTTAGLMIETRSYTTTPGSTTTRCRVSLIEVRVVTQQRGDVAFPAPRADLASGRTSTADQGEAPTEPVEPPLRRQSLAVALFGGPR